MKRFLEESKIEVISGKRNSDINNQQSFIKLSKLEELNHFNAMAVDGDGFEGDEEEAEEDYDAELHEQANIDTMGYKI